MVVLRKLSPSFSISLLLHAVFFVAWFFVATHSHVADRAKEAKYILIDVDPIAKAKDDAEKKKHVEAADKFEKEALGIWRELNEPVALAHVLRIQAAKLAEQGRFLEAIALLDKARNESNEVYWETSDTIIDYKQRGGLQLSLSEKKAVLRKEQGDTCQGMPGNGGGAAAVKPAA